MKKVFFGGSRNVSRLNATIRERVDNVVRNGLMVLVGDANGADKALQKYLVDKGYPDVVVFCAGSVCRNNLGRWPTEFVQSGQRIKDFEHYARKDARMSEEAEYGLFLWDGKSRGTFTNIHRLVANNKCALVYFAPIKRFLSLKTPKDFENLLGECDPVIAKTLRGSLKPGTAHDSHQTHLDLS